MKIGNCFFLLFLSIAGCAEADSGKFYDPTTQMIYDKGLSVKVEENITAHERARKENNLPYPERTPEYINEVRKRYTDIFKLLPVILKDRYCLFFIPRHEITGTMPLVCFDENWSVVESR